MIDTTLIDTLKVLAQREKKIQGYKRRLRVKGKVIAKGMTKSGNIRLTVGSEGVAYTFTILKSHKERYALAEKLAVNQSVSVEGIRLLRTAICTRLKTLDRAVSEGKQAVLCHYTPEQPVR